MRYIAAAALHQKALKVLSLIEDAEERINKRQKKIDRLQIVPRNWQEELSIWPLGKPNDDEKRQMKEKKAATEAAHARLCKYYQNILSRLIDIS